MLQYFLSTLIIAGLLMRSAFVAVAMQTLLRQIPRFQVRPGETAFIALLVAIAQLAAFPPMRAQGDWVLVKTGEPIGLSEAWEIEQAAFGKYPHYVWPGTGWRDDSGYDAVLHQEVFHSDVIERKIAWGDLAIEIAVLGLVMVAMTPRSSPRTKKPSMGELAD
jgi:hypothetical protein